MWNTELPRLEAMVKHLGPQRKCFPSALLERFRVPRDGACGADQAFGLFDEGAAW